MWWYTGTHYVTIGVLFLFTISYLCQSTLSVSRLGRIYQFQSIELLLDEEKVR